MEGTAIKAPADRADSRTIFHCVVKFGRTGNGIAEIQMVVYSGLGKGETFWQNYKFKNPIKRLKL